MLYIIVSIRDKDLRAQVYIILPIWIIGFLWAIESAVYVTAILGPFVLYHLMYGHNKLRERIKILLVFPFRIIDSNTIDLFVLLMAFGESTGLLVFYRIYILRTLVDLYFAEPINIQGPIWVTVIIVSWMLTYSHEYTGKYSLFCVMAVLAAILVILPYWVAHSLDDVVIFKLMVPVIFGLFLLFSLLDKQQRIRHLYHFFPILIMILVMTFGTPQSSRHIYDTMSNQDYTLENTIDDEVDDMHHIFSIITPGDIPVTYVDPGRYRFFLRSNQYKDSKTGKMVALSNKIWLPLHPADLFWDNMPLERKVEYINRWLIRHPVNKGWVVNANEQSHWWGHFHILIMKLHLNKLCQKNFR